MEDDPCIDNEETDVCCDIPNLYVYFCSDCCSGAVQKSRVETYQTFLHGEDVTAPFTGKILICRCVEAPPKKYTAKMDGEKTAAHEPRTGGITWFSYSYLFSAVHLHIGISEWLNSAYTFCKLPGNFINVLLNQNLNRITGEVYV